MEIETENLISELSANGAEQERALYEVYQLFAEHIRGFYRSNGVSSEIAEDLLHETFVKVLKNLHTFRKESQFSAWLWAIARNELKMYWRSAKRREVDTDPEFFSIMPVSEGEEGHSVTDQVVDCVRKAIDSLSSVHREYAEVIRLITRYEWSIGDIAVYLGKKPGATREYLSQARKRLKPYITHCYELLRG